MDATQATRARIDELIGAMTLEEKASLLSGRDNWHTKAVERLGVPSIMVADGPHGLRKELRRDGAHRVTQPSTCFPTAGALASSWDRELAAAVGRALGEECQAADVQVLLGPGVNVKRSPLGGRNFEYLSEDPYLAGELATGLVQGIQSTGVGACVKHFAVNSQETRRLSVDAIVDERTLHEIYLPNFEAAIVRGGAWTVMSAYNQVNGAFCSENPYLLTDVLRDRFGFTGLCMTDWGGVNERVEGVRAGQDLEMPYIGPEHDGQIVRAVRDGTLDEAAVDRAVAHVLGIVLRAHAARRPGSVFDPDAHHALARRAAAASVVLLKNEGAVLPLSRLSRVAVLGAFATDPRFQGGGSSHVNPSRVDVPLDELRRALGPDADVAYADGYAADGVEADPARIAEAAALAAGRDVAVVYAGLPEAWQSEGFDRRDLALPAAHVALIEAVARVQPRVVVVLSNGGPVEMPWADRVCAIVTGHLGGQAIGGALADVLAGAVNPAGKLAETYPVRLADTPAYLEFPGGAHEVRYGEGLFVGYRWYDARAVAPRFPFGHGLSYTTFAYRDIRLGRDAIDDTQTLAVEVTVANTGDREGAEVVQLYVRDVRSSVVRPVKELKGFAKVRLAPGESRRVAFALDRRAFAFWHTGLHDWFVESGTFEIRVGSSSASTPLVARVEVQGTQRPFARIGRKTKFFELEGEGAVADDALRSVALRLRGIEAEHGGRGRDVPRLVEGEQEAHEADLRSLSVLVTRMPEADLEAFIADLNARLGT